MKNHILFVLFSLLCFGQLKAQNLINFNGYQYVKVDGIWKFKDPTCNAYYNVCSKYINVKYVNTMTKNQIKAFQTANNLVPVFVGPTGWHNYRLTTPSNDIFALALSLQNTSEVDMTEITTYGKYLTGPPDDTYYSQQWYFEQSSDKDMDMHGAWDLATGTNTIKVGVIDGGLHWEINDLGMGTDGYQNIFTNTAEAWPDPNNPGPGTLLNDGDGNGKPGDYKGWHFEDPAYWPQSNDTRNSNPHGTRVASIIAGKTNNGQGIAGVAGGWNGTGVQIIGAIINCEDEDDFSYNDPISALLPQAIQYCKDHGVKVINMSLGVGYSLSNNAMLDYAWANGITVVCAAGNENQNTIIYPANYKTTIAVGGSSMTDFKSPSANFGTLLDIVAPGENIKMLDNNGQLETYSATSFSTPLVTGIVALMLQVNPCLSPEQIRQILRATAEKTGGYNYNWNYQTPGRSLEMGYGRVNAHQAVLAAQNMINPNFDLYVRDHYLDYGPDACYPFTWDFDESPDVWVRNQNDGVQHQQHEDYIHYFDANGNASTKYIYVRVTNRGCTPSSGNESVVVNGTAAGSNNLWPGAWTDYMQGGMQIGTADLPVIQPGESYIAEIEWEMMFGVNQCLLTRIVDEAADPIGTLPSELAMPIWQQNNIALRNVVVYNLGPEDNHPVFEGVDMEHGGPITFSNGGSSNENFDFEIISEANAAGSLLTTEAEVTLTFNDAAWGAFERNLRGNPGVTVLDGQTVKLLNPNVAFDGINLSPDEVYRCYLGFNFLTEEVQNEQSYEINFVQKHSLPHDVLGDYWTGGVHFKINRNERDLFVADAGPDKAIELNETATLNATSINEPATYSWYIGKDLVGTGLTLNVSPETTTEYTLEVNTNDGHKDYDQVTVFVTEYSLNSVSPNPTEGTSTVQYIAEHASSARFDIVGINTSDFMTMEINPASHEAQVDFSNLAPGIYSIILVCDGELEDVIQVSVY